VAISGWTKASDKILARLAGFDHHVGKPFDAENVLRFLSSVARQ
jgi:DNA-binding response OmpR family regulator